MRSDPVDQQKSSDSPDPVGTIDVAGPFPADSIPDGNSWLASGRLPSLDGLRAIAVILVILGHSGGTAGYPFAKSRWMMHGANFGVQIFFVLSGFLITLLLLREIARTHNCSLLGFYRRRCLRVLPAYIGYLVTLYLLQRAGEFEISRTSWIAAATFTVNFLSNPTWEIGHIWSLSIEEHFYLVWPLVLAFCSVAWARRIAIACIVGCFLGRWIALLWFPSYVPMVEWWTFTRIDGIAIGCMLALIAWDPDGSSRLNQFAAHNRSVAFVVVALIGVQVLALKSAKIEVGFSYTLNGLGIALLLWTAMRRQYSVVGHILNARALAFVGIISYSLYLWQQIFLARGRVAFYTSFPQNIAFAFTAACASYFCIEKPFLRLKDTWEASKPKTAGSESLREKPASSVAPREISSV